MPRIFVTESEMIERRETGRTLKYQVVRDLDGTRRLRVWQNGKLEVDAKLRDYTVYAVTYGKGPVSFTPYKAPYDKVKLVADLLGAPKEAQSNNADYEKKIRDWRRMNSERTGEQEKEYTGESYRVYYSGVPGHRQYCVACFISEAITLPEIISLLPLMVRTGFSERFIRRIIITRLNIREESWDRIRNSTTLIDL